MPQYVMMPTPARQRNGLGLFGFLVAFVGLFIPTGIVCILGLMLSLVAVGRAPRGLAATGVVLGLIGTIFWLVVSVAVVLAGLVAAIGAVVFSAGAFVLVQPEVVEITSDMVNVTLAAREHQRNAGETPSDLHDLGLGVATMTDPWGNGYRFEAVEHEPGFDVTSAGRDGAFDTDDDVALSRLDHLWEQALVDFEQKMDEIGNRLDGLHDEGFAIHHDGSRVHVICDRFVSPESYYPSVAARQVDQASRGR
jgi:hypothetical protein